MRANVAGNVLLFFWTIYDNIDPPAAVHFDVTRIGDLSYPQSFASAQLRRGLS